MQEFWETRDSLIDQVQNPLRMTVISAMLGNPLDSAEHVMEFNGIANQALIS